MNQRLLLTLAGFVLVSIFVLTAFQTGWAGASTSFFAAACGRVGLIVLAIALAWPQLVPLGKRFPAWFWVTLLLAGSIVVIRPKLIPVAIGLVVAAVAIQGGLGWINRNIFRGP